MAKKTVAAPPSQGFAQMQKVQRAKVLRGKGSGRSAAETQELVDTLTALVPDDVRSALGA
jgi:hypothetical protein